MFTKILVPLDGSPEAEAALEPAVAIADKFGAAVTLLEVTRGYGEVIGATVAESFGASGSVAAAAEWEKAVEAQASAYLDGIRQERGKPDWETVVLEGDAAKAIVHAVEQGGFDLVVMASHAHSGLRRLFLGSVAEEVIRKGGVPVLVIHVEPEED